MSFYQNKDGALTCGFGQRYVKYDVWEEKFSIANYLLPIDFSHAMDNMQKMGIISSANTLRPDGKHVRTVCLNIDASKVGKTLSDEELAKMDESDKFGDIAGIGRNWAHIKGGIKNFKNIYCNL